MNLELPPAYSAIEHDDCYDHARNLAANGAEEGTIVYASRGRSDISESGNVLEFSLIIQPDFDAARTRQLQVIAAISLGEAIASVVTPMVTLRYGWPADVRLNDLTVASCCITLASPQPHAQAATTPIDWATLEIRVYIDGSIDPSCTTVNEHCESPITDRVILEAFSRNFLSSINRWATKGMPAVSKPWRQRFDFHENEIIQLRCALGELSGVIEGVEEDATLILNINGETRQIQLADAIAGESTRFNETT